MKLFCECNSRWDRTEIGAPTHIRRQKLDMPANECLKCGMCKWYEADRENMMFDLKSMNS